MPIFVVKAQAERTWIDLSGADRLAHEAVWEHCGLPPEVLTYFLLRHHSAKVIHTQSILFLVTFFALPSIRSLFTLQELKLCVTPTRIVTLCGPSGRRQSALALRVPELLSLSAEGVGPCLCGLLAGVVASYEAIVNRVESRHFPRELREEWQRWGNRTEKFLRFLRDERVLLRHVAHEGIKLLTSEECQRLLQLEERVDALARRVWSAARRPDDEAPSSHLEVSRNEE